MSWMKENWVVTECKKADLYKDWILDSNKYPLSKALSKEDAEYAMSISESAVQTGMDGQWIVVEDKEQQAIFTNLEENPESFTGYNG